MGQTSISPIDLESKKVDITIYENNQKRLLKFNVDYPTEEELEEWLGGRIEFIMTRKEDHHVYVHDEGGIINLYENTLFFEDFKKEVFGHAIVIVESK